MEKEKYAKVVFNNLEDSFELWLDPEGNDDWGFACSTKCRAIGNEEDTNFIHYEFMMEILRCICLGYKVSGWVNNHV